MFSEETDIDISYIYKVIVLKTLIFGIVVKWLSVILYLSFQELIDKESLDEVCYKTAVFFSFYLSIVFSPNPSPIEHKYIFIFGYFLIVVINWCNHWGYPFKILSWTCINLYDSFHLSQYPSNHQESCYYSCVFLTNWIHYFYIWTSLVPKLKLFFL